MSLVELLLSLLLFICKCVYVVVVVESKVVFFEQEGCQLQADGYTMLTPGTPGAAANANTVTPGAAVEANIVEQVLDNKEEDEDGDRPDEDAGLEWQNALLGNDAAAAASDASDSD